jgi:hypothetical protein
MLSAHHGAIGATSGWIRPWVTKPHRLVFVVLLADVPRGRVRRGKQPVLLLLCPEPRLYVVMMVVGAWRALWVGAHRSPQFAPVCASASGWLCQQRTTAQGPPSDRFYREVPFTVSHTLHPIPFLRVCVLLGCPRDQCVPH